MKILIKNVDIITCDDSEKVIKDAFVTIKNGYIEYIGKNQKEDFKPDRIIDGKNKVLMPGLINAHTHCGMTILRNYANDLKLEDWLFNNILPTEEKLSPEDIYWGTLLGITEMIKTGTTTFLDMYLHMNQVAKAVCDAGIRANLSKNPLDFDENGKITKEDYSFFKKWHNAENGRIKTSFEVHSVYLFNEESLTQSAKCAKELGTRINIHILETERERKDSLKMYKMSPVEIALKTGILDVPVTAAHCIHLSQNDFDIIKEKGVDVVHNPSSNLKLGSGIAKVPELLKSEVNVSLGTDGAASNNNLNMMEEMHLAALIHKGVKMDPTCVKAYDVLKMSTVNGSKALDFEKETGLIKQGMKADVILIDMDKPHICPVNDPVSAVVYSAQGSDVDTVIIDGNIVMEKGELKTIDEERVKFQVNKTAKRII
ncbi:amidohydrolase [Herbivorax sp. ANBcel31]|uniref:amidohydrolase n=1 Tax=Herbivorax sp. ANBcel31 TaxID=3069754 RepID=UPI0027B657ED|nr:amidohydrolase [Herbivorax sp. ANBcel31]MDQ2085500.1 amidohydrolase [Herbivorax sp. ANBcel31]